jgi:hypothetical protein
VGVGLWCCFRQIYPKNRLWELEWDWEKGSGILGHVCICMYIEESMRLMLRLIMFVEKHFDPISLAV